MATANDLMARATAAHNAASPPPKKEASPLVVFIGEYEYRFVGDDAKAAHAALTAYLERNQGRMPAEMTGTDQKLVFKYLPRLRLTEAMGVPHLSLPATEWNDHLHALYAQGITLTGLPLEN